MHAAAGPGRQKLVLDSVLRGAHRGGPIPCSPGAVHYGRYEKLIELAMDLTAGTGREVIDIGAGGGIVSICLSRLGCHVTAVDSFAEYARNLQNAAGSSEDIVDWLQENRIAVVIQDIVRQDLRVPDASYDLAIFSEVVEHFSCSPRFTLAQIYRILRPGGYLLLTTPNLATLGNRLSVLAGGSNHASLREWHFSEPHFSHVHEYTLDEVKLMLEWVRSRVVQTKFPDKDRARELMGPTRPGWKKLGYGVYLALTRLFPSLRYLMFVIARKPSQRNSG